MSVTDVIEEKMGLTIDKLSLAEKQTYFEMLKTVQDAQLTPEKLKDYIISLRDAVSKELANEPEYIRVFIFNFENRKQVLLKARLLNYILLEAFLTSPERAKAALEDMVARVVPVKT